MWYVGEHSLPAQHASHDAEYTLTWALVLILHTHTHTHTQIMFYVDIADI